MSSSEIPMNPQFVTHEALKIRYVKSEVSGRKTALLLSPWPESLYAFAPVWPYLANSLSVVAVDLPGFEPGVLERAEGPFDGDGHRVVLGQAAGLHGVGHADDGCVAEGVGHLQPPTVGTRPAGPSMTRSQMTGAPARSADARRCPG